MLRAAAGVTVKVAPVPIVGFDLDPSLVRIHDLAGDEETEPEPFTCRALLVNPVEPVEDMRQ